ncbi:Alpha/beta-hydrolase [Mycena sanguinolenta]|uniref:Alpha/beta-hydrolase n=1 Tax=Mycena sanguinolenta TaxID=230812 RepID=A0A8H6ZB60_9AGAR|nr:Alpha/beta-hydrolase [Mycena sanguinolenta]
MLSFAVLFFFCLALVERGFSTPLFRRDNTTTTAANGTTPLTDADIQSLDLVNIAAFAAAAYCVRAGSWDCGVACNQVPDTQIALTIGDDAATPDAYVAYSQSRNQIIVGHEGTDPSQILSVENDVKFAPTPLLTVLNVAGTPAGVEVHNGFQTAWVQTSTTILDAVQQILAQVPTASVLVTGHSLGAAVSLLDAIFLKQQLPSNTSIQVMGFGRPRVGNQAFADWVDSMFGDKNGFVVSRDDPVPHVPLLDQGFVHASGEIWIKDNTTTLSCAGQENPNCSDSIGVLDAATGVSDHTGPYFGIDMGHAPCANLEIITTISGTPVTTTAAQITTPFSTALSIRTEAPTSKNSARSVGVTMGGVVAAAAVALCTVAGTFFAL